MKRWGIIFLALAAALSVTACGGAENGRADGARADSGRTESGKTDGGRSTKQEEGQPAERVELVVFAAASMSETLNQIIKVYEEIVPEVKIIATYDSSGTLKTQIQEGAPCDLFISAAQKQMNQLDASQDAADNPDRLDFVLQGTRVNLLENKVVLAVPDQNPRGINSFRDLASDKLTLLCIGNGDVPVGAYSEEILTWLGVKEKLEEEGRLTYGSNVKEVTSQVREGAVDAGIIYATDAFSAGLTVVDQADGGMCRRVVYPAAVLNITGHESEARAFLSYLQCDEAMEIFASVGFTKAE